MRCHEHYIVQYVDCETYTQQKKNAFYFETKCLSTESYSTQLLSITGYTMPFNVFIFSRDSEKH